MDESSPFDNIDGGMATNCFQTGGMNIRFLIILVDGCQPILNKMDGGIPSKSFPTWWMGAYRFAIKLMEGCPPRLNNIIEGCFQDWWIDAYFHSIIWWRHAYLFLAKLMDGWSPPKTIDVGMPTYSQSNSWRRPPMLSKIEGGIVVFFMKRLMPTSSQWLGGGMFTNSFQSRCLDGRLSILFIDWEMPTHSQ